MGYVCHSGGCPGADMAWETAGEEYGVVTHAYSFAEHTQYGKNQVVLTDAELSEGFNRVTLAAKKLKRDVTRTPSYIKKLLSRNWFQVKNGSSIFAIGTFDTKDKTTVSGGTGWAVQMAKDMGKPIFVYDQDSTTWHQYNYTSQMFEPCEGIPTLTENFAGVGSRDLTDAGMQAILDIYKAAFSN